MQTFKFKIRQAMPEDLDAIMAVFAQARAAIAALGIDQWQDGYPAASHIEEDMQHGVAYVLCEGKAVQGYFAMLQDPEPTYKTIYEGAWLHDGAYMTVHRVAMSDALRGKGAAAEAMAYVVARALRAGLQSVRIDTHEGNLRMRNSLRSKTFALVEPSIWQAEPRVWHTSVICALFCKKHPLCCTRIAIF